MSLAPGCTTSYTNEGLERVISTTLQAAVADAYAEREVIEQNAEKAAQEEAAMRDMTKDLSLGTKVMVLWREYEEQTTIEAKFVKALDKIEGFLHIAEGEVAMYIPKEFHGDYANRAVAAFDEATEHFPGLKDLLDAVKADLRKQFTAAGVEWVEVITQKNA